MFSLSCLTQNSDMFLLQHFLNSFALASFAQFGYSFLVSVVHRLWMCDSVALFIYYFSLYLPPSLSISLSFFILSRLPLWLWHFFPDLSLEFIQFSKICIFIRWFYLYFFSSSLVRWNCLFAHNQLDFFSFCFVFCRRGRRFFYVEMEELHLNPLFWSLFWLFNYFLLSNEKNEFRMLLILQSKSDPLFGFREEVVHVSLSDVCMRACVRVCVWVEA